MAINGEVDLSFLENAQLSKKEAERLHRYGDTKWITNDSNLWDYAVDAPFDGKPSLQPLIEEQVGIKPENVGLDLAGGTNGEALKDLLDRGVIGKGLLTNYEDKRNRCTRDRPDLDHRSGDLLKPATWQAIIEWQQAEAPEGLAVIMHRPLGGLQTITPRGIYGKAAGLLLDMLKPGGIIFAQIPLSLLVLEKDIGYEELCSGIREREDVDKITLSEVFGAVKFPVRHGLIYKKSEDLA